MSEQRTLGWYRARLGRITGSAVGDIMGKGKGAEFTKTGLSYLNQLVAERLLSSAVVDDDEMFQYYLDEVNGSSKAMRIGIEREAEARALYEHVTGLKVTETSIVVHAEKKYFASSPDGVVFNAQCTMHNAQSKKESESNSKCTMQSAELPVGCVEIKCPTPAVYVLYLTGVNSADDLMVVNPRYFWQCHAHMAVTGAEWCDFVVYCPYLSKPLHVVRIRRDVNIYEMLMNRVADANGYVEGQCAMQGAQWSCETMHNAQCTMHNEVQSAESGVQSEELSEVSGKSEGSESAECRGQSAELAKADMAFMIEALGRLAELHPTKTLKEQNYVRKCRLLASKLKRKQSKAQKLKEAS